MSQAFISTRPESRPADGSDLAVFSLAPFRILPPDSGGRAVIAGSCREMNRRVKKFRCLSLCTLLEQKSAVQSEFDYREKAAASSLLIALDRAGMTKVPYFSMLGRLGRSLAREAVNFNADLVEVYMPWLMTIRRFLPKHIPVVLHMQNVERIWYEDALADSPFGGYFAGWLERMECRAVHDADLVSVLTPRDGAEITRRYGIPGERIRIHPPGFEPRPVRRSAKPAERGARLKLVFVGSQFSGNRKAAEVLCRTVAPACLDFADFIVAGAVCDLLKKESLPPNVQLAGFVSDLDALFATGDYFVNPGFMSTGINIKVLDAVACGLPVVCTPEGAQGYEPLVGGAVRVAEIDDFPAALRQPPASAEQVIEQAAGYFSWSKVIDKKMADYHVLLAQSCINAGKLI